jgi:hypothetical protein
MKRSMDNHQLNRLHELAESFNVRADECLDLARIEMDKFNSSTPFSIDMKNGLNAHYLMGQSDSFRQSSNMLMGIVEAELQNRKSLGAS